MTSDNQQKQKTFLKIGEETDLSIEVVILLILGVFMFLFGLLLFKINIGDLPYNPDSTYGLFLVIVSFQIITMGKTPFGDLHRSWALIIIGICTAILGMLACFIPGYLSEFVRILVGIILLTGGSALLLQLFISEEKAKIWIKISGILQQLTIACALVYIITVILGLITLFSITTVPQTAAILIIYGISFFYLSWCIYKVSKMYPPEEPDDLALNKLDPNNKSKGLLSLFNETSLHLAPAILLVLAILLTLLGILLFPVFFGLMPYSPDGEFGLLLFIYAIQIMALGETPIGPYKRSRLMIIIGLVFATLGVFSCIVPGILTGIVQILIGLLSIIGGVILLIKRFLPQSYETRDSPVEKVTVPPIVKQLMVTQTLMNIVAIVFGVSALVGGLLPGLVVAGMLVIYGLILLVLVFILQKMNQIEISGEQPAENPA